MDARNVFSYGERCHEWEGDNVSALEEGKGSSKIERGGGKGLRLR